MCVEGISIGVNNTVSEIAEALGLVIYGGCPTERRNALIHKLRQLVQRKELEAASMAIHETVNTIASVFELDIPPRNNPIERRDILIDELKNGECGVRKNHHKAVVIAEANIVEAADAVLGNDNFNSLEDEEILKGDDHDAILEIFKAYQESGYFNFPNILNNYVNKTSYTVDIHENGECGVRKNHHKAVVIAEADIRHFRK